MRRQPPTQVLQIHREKVLARPGERPFQGGALPVFFRPSNCSRLLPACSSTASRLPPTASYGERLYFFLACPQEDDLPVECIGRPGEHAPSRGAYLCAVDVLSKSRDGAFSCQYPRPLSRNGKQPTLSLGAASRSPRVRPWRSDSAK